MGKKKKKNKGTKGNSLNYKPFIIIGGIFNFIVYKLLDLTFYNDSLFWWSFLICGLISGIYLIKKMRLTESKSYKKIEGIKLKLFMFSICLLMIIGTTGILGNVVNGAILGLNYIGKNNELKTSEYKVVKIEKNSGSRSRKRRLFRKTVPKVFFQKNEKLIDINLSENYSSKEDYSEFKTIELKTNKGMFGFEIVENYELKK